MMRGWRHSPAWLGLPVLVGAFVLVVAPLLMTVGLAFCDYDAVSPPRPSGLSNLRKLWVDPLFWSSVRASAALALLSVPLRLLLALAMALLLTADTHSNRAGRVAAYLPSVIPENAYALAWLWLLNPVFGPFGAALEVVGLGGGLLLTEWGARLSIAAMLVFQVGELYVVLLAARRELPHELYELCAVEGASSAFVLRHVTLPLLMPTVLVLAARDVAWSLQATFVPSLVVTHGGPRYATTFLSSYAYQNAFEYMRLGYASAITLAMFLVAGAMVLVTWAAFRPPRAWRRDHAG